MIVKKGVISKGADEAHATSSSSYEKEVEMQHQIEGKLKQDIDATLMTMFKPNEYKVNTKVSVNYDEVHVSLKNMVIKVYFVVNKSKRKALLRKKVQIRSKALVLQQTAKYQITVRTIIKMAKLSTIIKMVTKSKTMK